MRKVRLLALLTIAAHWIVGVSHLLLVAKILPPPENTVSWLAVGLMTLLHASVSVLFWKLRDKWAGFVLLVLFVAALCSGLYEHLLHRGLNNVFFTPSGDWTGLFDVSVFVLFGLEILGCWFGIHLVGNRPRHKTPTDLAPQSVS